MDAAEVGGVARQIVRDWVLRFNAEGPDGLIDRKAPGKRPLLPPAQRTALAAAVAAGPKPCLDGVVRRRLIELAQWLWDKVHVAASETTVSRDFPALGHAKLSARPETSGQDPKAIEAFLDLVAEVRARVGDRPVEMRFQEFATMPPPARGSWRTRGSGKRTS